MSVYAILKVGGEQHRVTKGQTVTINKIEKETGSDIEFDTVLMVKNGETTTVGAPTVEGCKVVAEIVNHKRGDKVKVFKFKRRQNYARTIGHRDWLTEVKIKDIIVK